MVEEEFYFHLGKADLIEWELSEPGGFSAYLERAIEANRKGDARPLGKVIKELITRSIGERGLDNREFDKKDGAVAKRFMQTDAYSVLYMEFGTNADAAGDFLTALAPKDMRDEVAREVARRTEDLQLPAGDGSVASPAAKLAAVAEVPDETPDWIRENRDMTAQEARSATPEQLRDAYLNKASRDSQTET